MRSATGGELTTLAGATRVVTLRVKVANGSGTMIDLSAWVESVSIEQDVDQPVSGCTIAFTRASGTLQSLSPLRTDSTLNVNDVPVYSPILDLNRSVTVEVATTAIGAAIVAGDYKLLFKGTVDVVNFEKSPVSIECRDLGAPLVDRWIEAETTYGSGGGTAIQTVMQNILDAVFGAAVYTLYVPVSPGFNIVTYRQQKMTVMDSEQDLVQVIGWDVRFKWDDGTSTFRPTLSEPPRTKTTPDYTFGPSAYHDITRLSLELTNIRNVITGSYRNSADFGNRAGVTVSDSASITKYGRRFFYIQEADISPIDTSAEMTTMLNAALADLKDPKADQEVQLPFFWPAELGDLYRFSTNGVHYNTNQDLAVVEIRHELSRNSHRTVLRVRGTPIGQYMTWLGRGGSIGGPVNGTTGQAFAPAPYIVPLNTEGDDTTWDLRFNAIYGSGGGGTNLTYTIKSKKTFGTETTLNSGNASAFPKDLTITRDFKQDQVITLTATDAATGMFASDMFTVPAWVLGIGPDGNLIGGYLDDGSVTKDKTESRFRCKVYKTAAQTLTNNTPTDMTFDAEVFDVGGLHDNVTSNHRITIPTGGDTGAWFFTFQCTFVGNATGVRIVYIYDQTATAIALVLGPPAGTTDMTMQVTAMVNAPAVGNYYYARATQNSGGDLNVSFGVVATYFSAQHLW